jgi:hypothetical protein
VEDRGRIDGGEVNLSPVEQTSMIPPSPWRMADPVSPVPVGTVASQEFEDAKWLA